jgi:tetratricopeptide (TPR) repeat protein
MRCRKVHEYISRSIDGELSDGASARLERHLAACDECRAVREDLRKIVAGAARLETPAPSDRVWLNVRAGLARETAGRADERSGAFRRPAFGLGLPALRYAGVAAAALVLVVTGVVVGSRLGRAPAPLGPEAREKYTLAKLDEAEHYYEQAIKSLGQAFAAGKGTLAPQVAELFERNLSVIDATIQACRRAVLDEPDDLEARNYLLAAYTQKITLLDSALDLQRRDRDAAGKAKIL